MNDGYNDIGQRVRVGVLLVQDGIILPGGASTGTGFFYVATGTEGASFPVVFPVAPGTTSYMVQASGAGLANFIAFDCPQTQYQADRFRLDCSAAPAAGDVIAVSLRTL